EAPDLETDRVLLFLKPVMEIDAERALLGETLDDANIAGRNRRCISLVESLREGVPVAIEQLACLVRRIDQRPRLGEPVGPGADHGRAIRSEFRVADCSRPPAGAPYDEMHADQRSFIRK